MQLLEWAFTLMKFYVYQDFLRREREHSTFPLLPCASFHEVFDQNIYWEMSQAKRNMLAHVTKNSRKWVIPSKTFNMYSNFVSFKNLEFKFRRNIKCVSKKISFKKKVSQCQSLEIIFQSYSNFEGNIFHFMRNDFPILLHSLFLLVLLLLHCPPKVKVQPALLFSTFVHNSSINELKNMKLIEHICYEMINWISYYCGFGNSL